MSLANQAQEHVHPKSGLLVTPSLELATDQDLQALHPAPAQEMPQPSINIVQPTSAPIRTTIRKLDRDIIFPLSHVRDFVVAQPQLQEWGFVLETDNDSGELRLPELNIDDGRCGLSRYFAVGSSDDVKQLMTRDGPSSSENTRCKRHFDSPLGNDQDEYTTPELQFEARNLFMEIEEFYLHTTRGAAVVRGHEYMWTEHDTARFPLFLPKSTKSRWFAYWSRICETAKWKVYRMAHIDFAQQYPHMQGQIFQRKPFMPGNITAPELLSLLTLASSRAILKIYESVEVFPVVAISVSGRDFRILQGHFNFQKGEYRVYVSKTLDFNKGISNSPYELSVLLQWVLCVPIPAPVVEATEAMSGLSID